MDKHNLLVKVNMSIGVKFIINILSIFMLEKPSPHAVRVLFLRKIHPINSVKKRIRFTHPAHRNLLLILHQYYRSAPSLVVLQRE